MSNPGHRVALTGACVAALLTLALLMALTTGVDREGNLHFYEFGTVIPLAFALLVVAAVLSSGVIDHPSQSSLVGGYALFLTSLVYEIATAIRHWGELFTEAPSNVAEIAFLGLILVGLASPFALLGGLLGAGASALLLVYRWLRHSVGSQHGAHFHNKPPMS